MLYWVTLVQDPILACVCGIVRVRTRQAKTRSCTKANFPQEATFFILCHRFFLHSPLFKSCCNTTFEYLSHSWGWASLLKNSSFSFMSCLEDNRNIDVVERLSYWFQKSKNGIKLTCLWVLIRVHLWNLKKSKGANC